MATVYNRQATFDVKFGIINLQGLMSVKDNVIEQPVFAHETYLLTFTLDPAYSEDFGLLDYYDKEHPGLCDGLSYQKLYRKNVRWDFGDGEYSEGFTVQHYYKTPGKYTITCTFFDINRLGVVNGYSLNIIVKQVLPTKLDFKLDQTTAEEIPCSMIEHIARVEATLSNNVEDDISIIPHRIYQEDETPETTWEEVKNLSFAHLKKYWCFLKPQQEFDYYTNEIYSEQLVPTEAYTPSYNSLYGYFVIENDQIVLKCYRIQPYASVEREPGITVNDPNKSILDTEEFTTYSVVDVSTQEELPAEAKYLGKRGFIDIFYRSDFISELTTISFGFDIEEINLHNSIRSSKNFLNIPPMGLSFKIIPNKQEDIEYAFTLNGFISDYAPVDRLVVLALAKNIVLHPIFIPYIHAKYNNYYIPKDFDLSTSDVSIVNLKQNDSVIVYSKSENTVPFLAHFTWNLKNYLNVLVRVGSLVEIDINYELRDLENLIIPTEQYVEQDAQALVDTYLPHPRFQQSPKLKKLLVDLFKNNNFLNYVLTRSQHFFDDNVNVSKAYVTNFLNVMQMMGQDAFMYDQTTFDGVNELRDLTRILSMNHSELVGNYVSENYDIKMTPLQKGKHVGDRLQITDKVVVKDGKITQIIRDKHTIDIDEPSEFLVAVDNYTLQSKLVNFAHITSDQDTNIYELTDYPEWGLLLPEKYDPNDKVGIIDSYYSFYLLLSNSPKEVTEVQIPYALESYPDAHNIQYLQIGPLDLPSELKTGGLTKIKIKARKDSFKGPEVYLGLWQHNKKIATSINSHLQQTGTEDTWIFSPPVTGINMSTVLSISPLIDPKSEDKNFNMKIFSTNTNDSGRKDNQTGFYWERKLHPGLPQISYTITETINKKYFINNFLDPNTITSSVYNSATWNETEGATYDMLLKVIYKALQYIQA